MRDWICCLRHEQDGGAHRTPRRWPSLTSGAHIRKRKCSPITCPASLAAADGSARFNMFSIT